MNRPEREKDQQIKDLIELNDELENYFRNTIIPQLFVDAQLILRKYTPPAMKHFEFSPDDLGKPFADLVDNIRYSVIVDDVKTVIESGEILEKEIQTIDLRWFQMNIIPYIIQKSNRPNGVIITFVDITERINTLRELEKLNASHETFIYSVSHDLKAPLANIEGLVTYWMESSASLAENNPEGQRTAQLMQKSVQSMRNIIDELSEFSKIRGQDEETAAVKLEDIIDDVKLILHEKINKDHVKIHLDIAEAKLPVSRKNLRSVIFNLLSNAIKYRSPHRVPEIHLKSFRVNGHVHISVKDNGLGIAPGKLDMLFKPYSRLEKRVEGTGIGLYLVKKIVESEGGEIFVNSREGEGTEFIVRIKAE
jgi:two-component system phosphate regulon sensor histidine kinase PhoR